MPLILYRCWLGRRQVLGFLSAALIVGCSTSPRVVQTYCGSSPAGGNSQDIVFVANGAGDFGSLSQNLLQVVADTGAPLEVKTVDWSLGYRRYIADQVNHAQHLSEGRRLADEIAAYRACQPGRRIYLIGHSAGCAVLLAAAELLPPDNVDRIVLLGPSVCRTADLRPALRSARCGIDVFYSNRDRLILGLGMKLFGTTEGGCREAAGQHGFTPIITTPADVELYSRLHQHPWHASVAWAGHDGRHFGTVQTTFLRFYVLPLLACK